MPSLPDKHFQNDPATLVLDALNGLCAHNPQLALDPISKVVYVSSPNRQNVALLCGGGSGHEPAHAGFVGSGILAAAVCGNVFASPSASQIRRALDLVENEKGTVMIVKNYTGDVLNFGLAKEQYAALHPDMSNKVRFVIVGDDVAVGNTQGHIVGRRGLAGTVLVYKIAGALAQRGADLNQVHDIAQWVSTRIGTVGVGLEHSHVPGTAAAENYLAADEIEIGMGIHGEQGHRRVSPVPPLNKLIPQLLELITSTTDPDRSYLPFRGPGKDTVVLLINNLGGTSELELYAVVSEARSALESSGISIRRVLCGTFMTSLNMPGFSITLLLMPHENESCSFSPELLTSLLDQATDVPGWKWSPRSVPTTSPAMTSALAPTSKPLIGQHIAKLVPADPQAFTQSIERACKALIAAEPEITRMDSIAGDGDCGLTLKSGATAVLTKLADGTITGTDIIALIIAISQVAEEHMGGTSGALYSIFFSALAKSLSTECQPSKDVPTTTLTMTQTIWSRSLSAALTTLYAYTRARPPSRTLVDPLDAFISTLQPSPVGSGSFLAARDAAVQAAENTMHVAARAGRSAYIEVDRLRRSQVPDPGAWGVKIILESL